MIEKEKIYIYIYKQLKECGPSSIYKRIEKWWNWKNILIL